MTDVRIYFNDKYQQFVVTDVDKPGRVGVLPFEVFIEQLQGAYACPPNMLCHINMQGKRAANDNQGETA